jgi:hypothetical protein
MNWKVKYNRPSHKDSLFCESGKIIFSMSEAADLKYLVQGGQSY